MKISNNYFNPQIGNPRDVRGKTAEKGEQLKGRAPSTDTLVLGASQGMEEKAFVSGLKNKISFEVEKSQNSAKVEDLADRIAKGQYQIDVSGLASKILGEKI